MKRYLFFALALVLPAVAFTGCSGGCSKDYHYSNDVNLNGRRTITRNDNGLKRTLQMRDTVTFQNGKITNFPKGTVVQLTEADGQRTITAELREVEGQPELWMQTNGVFVKGTASDQTWLDSFLQALKL